MEGYGGRGVISILAYKVRARIDAVTVAELLLTDN